MKAFDICCWSWHKTSLLPHMEFFSTFGKVPPFGNVPSNSYLINLLIWFEYFPRPEVDLSQLEMELNETIRFGNININNVIHSSPTEIIGSISVYSFLQLKEFFSQATMDRSVHFCSPFFPLASLSSSNARWKVAHCCTIFLKSSGYQNRFNDYN